jgi:RNA polymerase sigma factor FliA
MKTGPELWREWRQTRDPNLRERLIEQNLGLVKYAAAWVAGRLPTHMRLDDLYSAGMLGFLDAIENYDPDRGVEFAAYATQRIRGAIFDDLRRLDCVPRRVRRRIRDAQRAIEALSQELDREPTEQEVADALSMSLPEYQRLLGEGVTLMSLDASAPNRDDGGAPIDVLADADAPSPLAALQSKERGTLLGRVIDGLPDKERLVVALYYYEELTMQEIGKVLGLTESRVSQIHSSAILRITNTLRRRRVGARDLDYHAANARPLQKSSAR